MACSGLNMRGFEQLAGVAGLSPPSRNAAGGLAGVTGGESHPVHSHFLQDTWEKLKVAADVSDTVTVYWCLSSFKTLHALS